MHLSASGTMSARMVPNCLSTSKTRSRLAAMLRSTIIPRVCVALEIAHAALHPTLPTPAQLLKKARKKHKGKAKADASSPQQPKKSEDGA